MEIAQGLLQNVLSLVEVLAKDHHIVQKHVGHQGVVGIRCHWLKRQHIAGFPLTEKALRLCRADQKHIVIEIHEALCQVRNLVQIDLQHMAAEGGQEFRRNIVLMPHDVQLGMLRIQPRRQVAPGDKVDLPHPGRVVLHAPEPIPQKPPVPSHSVSRRPESVPPARLRTSCVNAYSSF